MPNHLSFSVGKTSKISALFVRDRKSEALIKLLGGKHPSYLHEKVKKTKDITGLNGCHMLSDFDSNLENIDTKEITALTYQIRSEHGMIYFFNYIEAKNYYKLIEEQKSKYKNSADLFSNL